MTVIQAVVLGAVQGLAEFIPVSSSAHLAVLPKILRWNSPGLVFDVALHLGTLLALLMYFLRERALTASGAVGAARRQPPIHFPHIILSCLPAVAAGILLEYLAETLFRDPVIIGSVVIAMGLVLLLADRLGKKTRSSHEVTILDWCFIGVAQALAIVPGVSRSGVTITAGLMRGFGREGAARLSFIVGAPLILGAAIYELRTVVTSGFAPGEFLIFAVGVLTAAVVGYLAIAFLLRYLQTKSTLIFVIYRVIFGSGIIAWEIFAR